MGSSVTCLRRPWKNVTRGSDDLTMASSCQPYAPAYSDRIAQRSTGIGA